MSFFFDHSLQSGWNPDGRWYPNSPLAAPDGYKFDTFPGRGDQFIATIAIAASGTIQETAIFLPAGIRLTTCAYMHGSTVGAGLTHRWMILKGAEGRVIGVTNDTTSTAPTASALNAFTFSAAFTTPYAGLYLLGLLTTWTTTAPTLTGFASTSAMNGLPPVLCGTGSTGQTTAPAVNALLAVTTAGVNFFYGCVG